MKNTTVFSKSDVLHYIPYQTKAHLDIGSNVGVLLENSFSKKKTQRLCGIEINQAAVEIAKERLKGKEQFSFYHTSADELPFNEHDFDVITATEVLEHIPTNVRAKAIKELRRVIKDNGLFVFTVPHKGFFHFLDPSNFRYYAPELFSFFSHKIGGRSRDDGFSGEKHGVIWHHHFTIDELEVILENQFQIVHQRFRGFLIAPVIEWIAFPLYRLNLTNSWLFRSLKKLQALEYKLNFGKLLGYNVLIVAKPV